MHAHGIQSCMHTGSNNSIIHVQQVNNASTRGPTMLRYASPAPHPLPVIHARHSANPPANPLSPKAAGSSMSAGITSDSTRSSSPVRRSRMKTLLLRLPRTTLPSLVMEGEASTSSGREIGKRCTWAGWGRGLGLRVGGIGGRGSGLRVGGIGGRGSRLRVGGMGGRGLGVKGNIGNLCTRAGGGEGAWVGGYGPMACPNPEK